MEDTKIDFRLVKPMSNECCADSPEDGSWGPMSEARLVGYEETGAPIWLCNEIRWQQAEVRQLTKQRDELTAQLAAMRAMLEKHCYQILDRYDLEFYCLDCGEGKGDPHSDACEISKALSGDAGKDFLDQRGKLRALLSFNMAGYCYWCGRCPGDEHDEGCELVEAMK